MSLNRLPGRVGEIAVDGNPTRVQASKTIAHDIAFHQSDLQLLRRELIALNSQPPQPPANQKWCPDCGEWRTKGVFSKHAGRYDGLQPYCKQHTAARDKRRYLKRKAISGLNS